jgi:hypothetical protein
MRGLRVEPLALGAFFVDDVCFFVVRRLVESPTVATGFRAVSVAAVELPPVCATASGNGRIKKAHKATNSAPRCDTRPNANFTVCSTPVGTGDAEIYSG